MEYHLSSDRRTRVAGLFGLTAALWLGLLVGVSFLATPVKFQAASLDLPTALDVGRVTFALSTRVEWALWALLAATAVLTRARGLSWVLVGLLGLALAAQSFWLLPILDERIGQIIAGLPVVRGPHHRIYIVVEAGKVLLLLAAVGINLRRVRAGDLV